ncbi:MAG: threonine synthase [Acidobacteria bacterium]|nr:threonine synthase [Acidobacteriota bacterium]MBV9626039.1 threonine synthase [Acidobacteriota bacterium]
MPNQVIKVDRSAPQLRCIACGRIALPDRFRCEYCRDLLEIIFPAWTEGGPGGRNAAGLKKLWRERRASPHPADLSGVWRFREILPEIAPEKVISLREGNTPLYELPHCARTAGIDHLYAKHQGMNPTGSFKDTGMTVAASFARQAGYRWVACASTGNTSASMAAYAARGGLHSLVLIPEGKISWGKLSQSLDYGALTCQLRTDFDGCVRVLNEVVERMSVYLLNSVNPYRVEGQKTAAFELLEQLEWTAPDHIIVPGGNLANSSALGKALREMQQLGFLARVPKLSVVQAQGANPLVRTIRETGGERLVAVQAETMASAIRIGNPASWKKALRVIGESGGTVEQVSETEIAVAKAEIGAEGIGCEPASAVTLAGLKKLVRRGFVTRGECVVLVLTGHVLKDADFTLKFHRGDLFDEAASEAERTNLRRHQRSPLVLDPSAEKVVELLSSAE